MEFDTDAQHAKEREISFMKRKLQEALHSYESVIFYFEQLLVWENPSQSAFFVFIVHLLFWYLKTCSSHIIGFLSGLLLVILWLDMWKDKIWPEIRAVAPDPDADEWGELHPRLPGLPELCQGMAEVFVNCKSYITEAIRMKQETPGKFCGLCIIMCGFVALIGHAVPGILLAYVIMLCGLILPVIFYRRLLERLYKKMEPFFMQLQYSMKPKMKRQKKHYPKPSKSLNGAQVEVITDSSGEDEMSSFINPLDAKTADLIARALTDESELSDSDESLLAHECPSLGSHGSSLDGDKDYRDPIPQPQAMPTYNEVQNSDDNLDALGFSPEQPSTPPNTETQTPGNAAELLLNPIVQQAAAVMLQDTVSSVLQTTASTLADWSKKQDSLDTADVGVVVDDNKSQNSSDDGFVILDKE